MSILRVGLAICLTVMSDHEPIAKPDIPHIPMARPLARTNSEIFRIQPTSTSKAKGLAGEFTFYSSYKHQLVTISKARSTSLLQSRRATS
jgi:hypothetical protein